LNNLIILFSKDALNFQRRKDIYNGTKDELSIHQMVENSINMIKYMEVYASPH